MMISINLNKKCYHCSIDLTSINAVKRSIDVFKNICKSCINKKTRDRIACKSCGLKGSRKFNSSYCSSYCSFINKVIKTENCWLWTGAINRHGYGNSYEYIEGNKKNIEAHRQSYKLLRNDFNPNLCVLHTCDVRKCVNPDHLWLGTHKENMVDMISKGRDLKRSKERNF